mgnify:FL=1
MIPPSAKEPLIVANAAITAATPAAIATKFIGNGILAPLAVAPAIASPDDAAVLADELATS